VIHNFNRDGFDALYPRYAGGRPVTFTLPSRLTEADYGGATDVLPALSAMVRETVPAEVTLTGVSPRRVAWGGTVRLTGGLHGGYLPAGGALVRLRIGQGKAVTTYGVREHVIGNGRFSTT
jgi:hypothetical protein